MVADNDRYQSIVITMKRKGKKKVGESLIVGLTAASGLQTQQVVIIAKNDCLLCGIDITEVILGILARFIVPRLRSVQNTNCFSHDTPKAPVEAWL